MSEQILCDGCTRPILSGTCHKRYVLTRKLRPVLDFPDLDCLAAWVERERAEHAAFAAELNGGNAGAKAQAD